MAQHQTLPQAFKDQLEALLGPKGIIADRAEIAPFLEETRGRRTGHAEMVALPASTEETAAVVRLCHQSGITIVPQGGNTGRVRGAQPETGRPTLLLNMRRMNRVRELDAPNNSLTAEAGCILQNLQEAANQADRLFPLSLGAQGSCQIGGNIASNAGGIHVLRYGNTRALVLGLEAVLPDGSVWSGLRSLRKDNSGYDLKQLLIGSEGTLGIITAATLRLFPKPKSSVSALVALNGQDDILPFFNHMQQAAEERLTAFELLPRRAFEFMGAHKPDAPLFLSGESLESDWFILLEVASGDQQETTRAVVEQALEQAFEQGLVRDAVLALSEQQAASFWQLRENIVEVQRYEGASIKHDISVPLSTIPAFIEEGEKLVQSLLPGTRLYCFGHVGDGNLHYNLSQPVGMDAQEFWSHEKTITGRLHDLVSRFGGSISAEHGIGRRKAAENRERKSPVEWQMMESIKQALDPKGIMNPGCLFPED
ncbi:FAD-binding oxidoreductase [Kiloniella sp. b19]|uniref:FAD-binding oxidoreductase n=1 Tax=Kiloniella sp. GXU_MW_B19 TaxID=3141326 RepID=UPI0031DC2DCB